CQVSFWSADPVGSHRLQQQRAGVGPRGGRGGGDDDAGAGPALDQAGDLLVVVAADPGDVVVDDARAGTTVELDPCCGGVQVGGGAVSSKEPQAEGGPVRQVFAALPGGGVEVQLVPTAGAESCGGDGAGVAGDRVQRGWVGQQRGAVGQGGMDPARGRR